MIWTCTFILANQYFLNIETYKSEQGHWKWCDPGMWPRDRLEYSMNMIIRGTVLKVSKKWQQNTEPPRANEHGYL